MKVNFSYSRNIKVQHTKTALRVLFFFEMGSHYVALAALELTKIPLPMLGVGLPQALGLNV